MTTDGSSRYLSPGGDPPLSSLGQLELVRTMVERGLSLRTRVYGSSMLPLIRDGDVVTIEPIAGREPQVGDVIAFVLPAAPETERLVLHRVVACEGDGWLVRGDNCRESDGVVVRDGILGSISRVERKGRDIRFGAGVQGTGVAWLSRNHVLQVLGGTRRVARRAASSSLRCAQGSAWYRSAGRRWAPRFDIEEADGADLQRARRLLDPGEAELPPQTSQRLGIADLLARRGGRAIGFVRLVNIEDRGSPWEGLWLLSLAVKGRFRGLGVGVALTSRVIERAREEGAARLLLAVYEDNDRAIRLFRKLGFEPAVLEAVEPGFEAERQLSGRGPVVMKKDLVDRSDESALAPELRAVLACARAVVDRTRLGEFRRSLAACADPDHLRKTAVAQGMLGHLARLAATGEDCAGCPPPAVDSTLVRHLAERQRASAHRCLRQTSRLLRILEHLEAEGVRAIPYKGPAWAERLYGDVTLRSWADLDLLVHYEQAQRTRDVLLANGFVDGNPFNDRILRRRHRGWGEVALSSADQTAHVEVHWEITVGFGGRSLKPETVFARAGRLTMLGREVASPSGVDCLVMTCLNGSKDRWNNVEGLLSLALQVPEMTPPMWKEAVATARTAGCLRRVAIGVAHVSRVFELQVPPEIAEIVAHDAIARALLGSLKPDSLDRGSAETSRRELAMKFWRFATEDSIATGLWHGMVRFFRPGPEDWEWLTLPRFAGWLYWALRPARLAVKWAKRL